jgi:8-oxo-dGTP diphosphatase
MRKEFSAGGVVFRVQQGRLLILLCQHSQNHSWGFPKGLVGDHVENESVEATALREVKEETGADGEILSTLEPVEYWYSYHGMKTHKTVQYFIMKYLGGDITQHDYEMENVEWVEFEQVHSQLTHEADREVFQKAIPEIKRLAERV